LLWGEVVVISAFPEMSAASNANGNETRFGHWIGQTWRPQIVSDEQLEVGPPIEDNEINLRFSTQRGRLSRYTRTQKKWTEVCKEDVGQMKYWSINGHWKS
jgi:hypothetical protein